MRRRDFIKGIVGSTATWPLAARGQQKVTPVVGFLNGGSADASLGFITAFNKGLNENGFVDSQNVTVEYPALPKTQYRLVLLTASDDPAETRQASIILPERW
jgi:hypothetical protein